MEKDKIGAELIRQKQAIRKAEDLILKGESLLEYKPEFEEIWEILWGVGCALQDIRDFNLGIKIIHEGRAYTETIKKQRIPDTKNTLPKFTRWKWWYQGNPNVILSGCYLPRGEWEELFFKFFEKNGLKGTGFSDTTPYFENDTFACRPYYWGDDDEVAALPNFLYKPTGLTISWYKYPLRGAWCNYWLTYEGLEKILKDCERSLHG